MRLTWISLCLAGLFFIPGWIKPMTDPSKDSPKYPSKDSSYVPSKDSSYVPSKASSVLDYFRTEAPLFSASCTALRRAIQSISSNHQSVIVARQKLIDCRLHYKKIEFFLEYFFKNSAHIYNGPPKYEAEEPFLEYQEPVGLQVIESLLFEKNIQTHRKALLQQAEAVESSAADIISLLYDFEVRDDQILESLRLELIRIMSLGITGYDAPLLKSGIRESYTALCSIQDQLQTWLIPGTSRSDSLTYSLNRAIAFLRKNSGSDSTILFRRNPPSDQVFFDSFDRLSFLKDYASPLQYQLGAFIREQRLDLNTNGILNYNAANLFSRDALNPDNFPRAASYNDHPDSGSSHFNDNSAHPDKSASIYLGKLLFAETALSGNGRKSCASCHSPEKMFTDGLASSIAFDGHSTLNRNAPSLLYCGFQYSQFWDGRVRTLEDQIKTVLHDPREMNADTAIVLKKLKASPLYDSLFLETFGISPGADRSSADWIGQIASAIASYVRTLHPMNAPFDRYMQGEETAMNASQKRGANLFLGKAQCATCHFIPLFNGLIPPDYKLTEFEVLGTTASDDFRHPIRSTDPGKYSIYPLAFNQGSFKTPTVRNTAATGPYMHNGAFHSLEKVMEFYNAGGGAGLGLNVPEQTLPSTPLHLNPQEIKDMISFMKALTDSLPQAGGYATRKSLKQIQNIAKIP